MSSLGTLPIARERVIGDITTWFCSGKFSNFVVANRRDIGTSTRNQMKLAGKCTPVNQEFIDVGPGKSPLRLEISDDSERHWDVNTPTPRELGGQWLSEASAFSFIAHRLPSSDETSCGRTAPAR